MHGSKLTIDLQSDLKTPNLSVRVWGAFWWAMRWSIRNFEVQNRGATFRLGHLLKQKDLQLTHRGEKNAPRLFFKLIAGFRVRCHSPKQQNRNGREFFRISGFALHHFDANRWNRRCKSHKSQMQIELHFCNSTCALCWALKLRLCGWCVSVSLLRGSRAWRAVGFWSIWA